MYGQKVRSSKIGAMLLRAEVVHTKDIELIVRIPFMRRDATTSSMACHDIGEYLATKY
jgi:hypothetical protein